MEEIHITNEVLASKLDNLREVMELKFRDSAECHRRIDARLATLNGNVAKNTEWRIKGAVYGGLVVFIVPIIIGILMKLI